METIKCTHGDYVELETEPNYVDLYSYVSGNDGAAWIRMTPEQAIALAHALLAAAGDPAESDVINDTAP